MPGGLHGLDPPEAHLEEAADLAEAEVGWKSGASS